MQDEHDRWRLDMQVAVKEEIDHSVRFIHLTRTHSSTSTQPPAQLVRLLPADTAVHYYSNTDDSQHTSDPSSVYVLLTRATTRTGNDWHNVLQRACDRLPLPSALDTHIQSVVTRWFASVTAFIGAMGYQRDYALFNLRDEQWDACCVQLSDGTRSADVNGRPFELMRLMGGSAVDSVGLYSRGTGNEMDEMRQSIIPLLVEQLLPVTVPTSVTELLSYGTIVEQIQSMRRDSLLFDWKAASRVLQWCGDINIHFLRSVRLVTLDRCRELLVNNDYQVYHADQPAALSSTLSSYPPLFFPSSTGPYLSATAAVNVSSLTPTPEPVAAPPVQLLPLRLQARVLSSYLASHSPISLHACLYSATLFELLGQSLHAYTVSPDLSSSLLSTLCDCILLLLSIPGVYNSDQLQSVGYMSWLFASDCSYMVVCVERMASFIVTECRLAPLSSASFFPSIGGTAPPLRFASEAAVRLLALVEPLRAVSQHWKRQTLTQLTTAVITSLDVLPPFTSLDSPATLRTTLSLLQQTINTLTRSLRSLKDVEHTAGRQLIARRLIGRLCDAVVDRVLAVEDVGIEEARGIEAAVAAVNCGEVREVVGGGWEGAAWRRLQAVQLLIGSEQTLVAIEAEWEAGGLSVLSGAEVCGWIRSLYQDSGNRQRLLQKIGGRQ